MANVNTKITNKGVISEKIADTDTPTFSLEINGFKGFGSKTRSEVNLYVNGLTGSDDNKGTAADPLKTVIAAESQIPDIVDHTVFIHVSSGSYTMPRFKQRALRNRIWLIGTDYNELVTSTTASAGSSATAVVTTGLTPDQYVGKTIEILDGDAAGDRRTIARHTATNITPTADFSSAISSGDSFRIIEPQTSFHVTGSHIFAENLAHSAGAFNFLIPPGIDRGLFFENIEFNWDATAALTFRNSLIGMYGCSINKTSGFIVLMGDNTGYLLTGFDTDAAAQMPVTDRGVDNNKSWRGWGLGSNGRTYFSNIKGHIHFALAGEQVFQYGGAISVIGGRFDGWDTLRSDEALASTAIDSTSNIKIRCVDNEIGCFNECVMVLDKCEVSNSAGNGVRATIGGSIQLNSNFEVISSTTGIKTISGGRVYLNSGITVNASGNEIEAGSTPITGSVSGLSSIGQAVDGDGGAFVVRSS